MLIARTITTIIVVPIFIGAIFYLPEIYFRALLFIIALVAAYEWLNIARLQKPSHIIAFFVLFLGSSAAAWYGLFIGSAWYFLMVLIISLLFWLVNLIFIVGYPRLRFFWYGTWWLKAINGTLVLVPMLVLLLLLYDNNKNYFLLFFILVWSADMGAYFVGRYLGKHQLAPKISPNKTVEGVIAGVLTVVLIMVITPVIVDMTTSPQHGTASDTQVSLPLEAAITPSFVMPISIVASILLALAAVCGDLYESLYKREAKVKDSGYILPGHGGILDRIDGLPPAIVIFTLFLMTG